MAALGDAHGVDHPGQAHALHPAQVELVVEEAEIEPGVVRDQRRIADEVEQVLGAVAEARLVGEEGGGQPVDRLGRLRACRGRD